jgi:hypothetical protein
MAALSLVILSLGYVVDFDFIMAIGFACGAIAGGTTLWLVISAPRQNWSCCDILAGSTIVWYYMGAAFSMWFADTAQLKFWNITKEYNLTLIYAAAIYLGIFCIGLHLCGAWERRFWRPALERIDAAQPLPRYLAYLLIAIGLAQVGLLATGKWSFGGYDTSAQPTLDPFTAAVVSIAWPIAPLCAFVLGRGRGTSAPLLYTTCMFMLPFEFVWCLANGRRIIVYELLAVVACYLWAKRSKAAVRMVIILGLIGGPVVMYASQLFLAIRMAQYMGGMSGARIGMLEHLSRGSAVMSQRTDALKRMQQENMTTRTFMIGYFASLIGNTKPTSPLIGLEIAINTLEAVPNFIFPPKTEIILKTGKHEELYHPYFNLYVRDEANSYATSSWVDFWLFGPLIYPAIMALLGVALARLTATVSEQWMVIYYTAYVLFSFMFVEETFTLYLLTLRTLLAISVLIFLMRLVLGRRPQTSIPSGRL